MGLAGDGVGTDYINVFHSFPLGDFQGRPWLRRWPWRAGGVHIAVVGRFVAGNGVLVLMGDWVRGERLCAGPSPGNPPGRREKTPKESGTFGV